ncbi:MAG: disulfide bond formation protein B [Methylobacterium sp.]|nr:disulfide bond formation protein B [Methylobacterium sp.]
MLRIGYDRREGALSVALSLAFLAICAAWFFELVLGYIPCKLCLWQRWPYYLGIPLIVLGLVSHAREDGAGFRRPLGALVALIFAASLALGVYHSGVEWGFWAGPSDCGGRIFSGPANVMDFAKQLETARAVSCTSAPWRFMGLSFAGWNAAISLLLMLLGFRAAANRM